MASEMPCVSLVTLVDAWPCPGSGIAWCFIHMAWASEEVSECWAWTGGGWVLG